MNFLKKLKLNKKTNMLLFVGVLLAVFVVLFLLSKFANRENFSNGLTLYFFYADWCPHCRNFKPTWAELENDSSISANLQGVDCTDNNNTPALATKYGVSSFPTLILVNGSNKKEYSGARTASAIKSFVNAGV
jgi:thiol-disulfide isomerase/thioredoxin